MSIRQSGEDYIETIFLLGKRQAEVHAIDIARELGFSKPSITRALNILKAKGLVVLDGLNHIRLTEEGTRIAEGIYERHRILTEFFVRLGVSKDNAEKDACRVEHVICDEAFSCIKKFIAAKNNS